MIFILLSNSMQFIRMKVWIPTD